jgi:hypothetical protein
MVGARKTMELARHRVIELVVDRLVFARAADGVEHGSVLDLLGAAILDASAYELVDLTLATLATPMDAPSSEVHPGQLAGAFVRTFARRQPTGCDHPACTARAEIRSHGKPSCSTTSLPRSSPIGRASTASVLRWPAWS